jgi:peptidoglycan hydrolase CwlO-like protein
MTRKHEWPLIITGGGLVIALLVCILLLAFPAYNNKTGQLELEVAKQEYTRQIAAMDRKYEQKINNLQEQLNTLQFISNKRYDLIDDDMKRMKREIDDLRERLRAPRR